MESNKFFYKDIIRCFCEKVDPYCDMVIKKYVDEINKELGTQVGETTHTWMREDLLTNPLYSCKLNGDNILLEEMLFGEKSVNIRQNIILVTGEAHIGKHCFVQKLLEDCKKTVCLENRGRRLPKQNMPYRIPIIIDFELYQKCNHNQDVGELITSIIEFKLSQITRAYKHEQLVWKINQLLAEGRFLIYFKGHYWLNHNEEDLRDILLRGDIVNYYKQNAKFHNLVIFTTSSELDVKESFINENNHVSIHLDRLTPQEVKEYLKKYIPNLLNIVNGENRILDILRYPENLKMFAALYHKKLLEEKEPGLIKDVFDFYDYFIRVNIKEQLKNVERTKNIRRTSADKPSRINEIDNPNRVNAIMTCLQKYASSLLLQQEISDEQPSHFFSFDDFTACGILDKSRQFVFPMCGYFLVAKQLTLELNQRTLREIPVCLLEKPLEVILLWTSKMINNVEIFANFWHLLLETKAYRLLLLAKIVRESQFMNSYIDEIYQRAFLNLKEDFYDYTVLEVFNEMGYDSGNYLKSKYLDLGSYDIIPRNNIKKRSVYYLGISHKGIIPSMLDELLCDDTDQHLKYHIIRAMVENYGEDEESTQLISDNFERLTDYCMHSSDAIIKSDFCVLYKKHTKNDLMAPSEAYELLDVLKERLEDANYWVRAHSAGAIGRRNGHNEHNEDLLVNRIEKELKTIYEQNGDYRNSIKVISYSVEAICEMFDFNKGEKEHIIHQLVRLIDINWLGEEDVEDAYSTIATGIEFLINADTNKPPFNLGGRFRNHIVNYQKVLLNIFQELEFFFDDEDQEVLVLVKEKQKQMEQIMNQNKMNSNLQEKPNKIRILQLSDWHFREKRARNNLIIQAVKNEIKKIDILVITGDLKDFGSNYDETLTVLKQLIESLGLTPKDVFMVPGNHDCEEYEGKEKVIEEIRKEIYHDEECYQKYLDKLAQGFLQYKAFLSSFYGDDLLEQGGINNQIFLWGNCVHILTMNTALLCDSNTEKDKIVNILELSEIVKENEDKFPTICISHHPMSKLQFDHESTVKQIFKNLKVSVLLSGDIHQSKLEMMHINPYYIPNYICGKFTGESGDQWSSQNIAVYELDLEKRVMVPQLYVWRNDSFVPDPMFCKRPDNIEDTWDPIEVVLL